MWRPPRPAGPTAVRGLTLTIGASSDRAEAREARCEPDVTHLGARYVAAIVHEQGGLMELEELEEPGRRLGRREFLIAGAGAGLSAAGVLNHGALARARMVPHATEGSFAYGVASGFPSTKGITLWTRVAGLRRSAKIAYEVATDSQFKHVVASSHATAQAGRDFTVHQPVSGLKPATEYYYRFATKKADSRVG